MGIAHRYIDSEDLIVTGGDLRTVGCRGTTRSVTRPGRTVDADSQMPAAPTIGPDPDHVDAISARYETTVSGFGGTQLAIVADDVSTLAEHVEQRPAALRVATLIFNSLDIACNWLSVDPDITHHTSRDG